MTLGEWLNSLTLLDHLVILVFFAFSGFLAHVTMVAFRHFVELAQKGNPYAKEFRTSPFTFFAVAIPYTIIIYKLLGALVTTWLRTLF